MKYATALFLGFAAVVLGKEIPKDLTRAAELYDSGFMHEKIMSEKEAFWAQRDEEQVSINAQNARFGAEAIVDPWPELHFAQCKLVKSLLHFYMIHC